MLNNLKLEADHNFLVEAKMKLLFAYDIYDSSDNAYKKLPESVQKIYLDYQSQLDLIHSEMIRGFIRGKSYAGK
jgi:hypothetical protein